MTHPSAHCDDVLSTGFGFDIGLPTPMGMIAEVCRQRRHSEFPSIFHRSPPSLPTSNSHSRLLYLSHSFTASFFEQFLVRLRVSRGVATTCITDNSFHCQVNDRAASTTGVSLPTSGLLLLLGHCCAALSFSVVTNGPLPPQSTALCALCSCAPVLDERASEGKPNPGGREGGSGSFPPRRLHVWFPSLLRHLATAATIRGERPPNNIQQNETLQTTSAVSGKREK